MATPTPVLTVLLGRPGAPARAGQAVVIPPAVWLCLRHGPRRMYMFSLGRYVVSGTLRVSATDIVGLVAF
jgi:hypothetical protein